MYQTQIGYAQLKVRDLDAAIDFYQKFLGLDVIERLGDQFAFLGNDGAHPALVLQNAGQRAPQTHPRSVGLYHLAFRVPDRHALALAYQNLTASNICVSLVNHRMSWAIYFNDPDGNGLAIYWDRRAEPGAEQMWRGCNVELRAEELLGKEVS